MASRTWDNGGGTRAWALDANWGGAAYPVTGDTAVFNNAAIDLPTTFLAAGNTISVEISGAFTLGATGLAPFIGTAATLGTCTFTNAGTVTLPTACAIPGNLTFNAAGTIACNAAGSTLTVSGSLAATAIGTLVNDLNITRTGTGTITWPLDGTPIALLTSTGAPTQMGDVWCWRFAGSGTYTAPPLADVGLYVMGGSDDYFNFTGTFPAPGGCVLGIGTLDDDDRVLNADIDAGGLDVYFGHDGGTTLTLNGDFTATHAIHNLAEEGIGPNIVVMNGNLTCAEAFILGDPVGGPPAGLGPTAGILVLGSNRTHRIGGLYAGGPAAAGSAVTFGGTVISTGHITLNRIATDFGTAAIVAGADLTIDGADATSLANTSCDIFANGHTLTVQNIGECVPPLRVWGQTGTDTDYVKFHGGAPSGLMLMGVGT